VTPRISRHKSATSSKTRSRATPSSRAKVSVVKQDQRSGSSDATDAPGFKQTPSVASRTATHRRQAATRFPFVTQFTDNLWTWSSRHELRLPTMRVPDRTDHLQSCIAHRSSNRDSLVERPKQKIRMLSYLFRCGRKGCGRNVEGPHRLQCVFPEASVLFGSPKLQALNESHHPVRLTGVILGIAKPLDLWPVEVQPHQSPIPQFFLTCMQPCA